MTKTRAMSSLFLALLVSTQSLAGGWSNNEHETRKPREIAKSIALRALKNTKQSIYRHLHDKLDGVNITWPNNGQVTCPGQMMAYTQSDRDNDIYICDNGAKKYYNDDQALAQILIHEAFHLITNSADEIYVATLEKETYYRAVVRRPIKIYL